MGFLIYMTVDGVNLAFGVLIWWSAKILFEAATIFFVQLRSWSRVAEWLRVDTSIFQAYYDMPLFENQSFWDL